MNKNQQAIGIFDSGMGGLTVMKEIVSKLPNENIVYFGDTARLPYGEKSPEAIIRFCVESIIFLMEQEIKLLVLACNTASSYAFNKLKTIFNIPIVEVIEPGVLKSIESTKNGKIAVLGTKATINSGSYKNKLQLYNASAEVYSIACPLFVPLAEEGLQNHPAAKLIAQEYLKELSEKEIDTLLLGCTHYPILKKIIQECLKEDINIVDSATACAEKASAALCEFNLKNSSLETGFHRFFVSDNPEKFRLLGQKFLGAEIAKVSLVPPFLAL